MDDLSNIFEEADKYLYKALFRWKALHPELWEDARQEGMIQVWRDVEAGETVKLKILRRASMVANKYVNRNGEYSFGKPKKSRDGLKSKRSTYEKVQAYLDEVMPVLGHWPTAKQVSDHTGLGYGNTQRILKAIREGRVDHMVYREDGRKDWDFYKTFSVETLGNPNAANNNFHWSDQLRFGESFEDDLISDMDFDRLVSQLNEHHREVLRLYFVECYTAVDLKNHYGLNSSAQASRHINAAINQARMLINPYTGECAAHHPRSPETTVITIREDGVRVRTCRACQGRRSAGGGAKKPVRPGAKIGRPSTKDCPNGHGPKTYQDSKGTMRCHTCKNEQALKSLRKKKDEGS